MYDEKESVGMTMPGDPPTSSAADTRHDEISIGELVRLLWDARWIIIVSTAAAACFAGALALMLPKKYEASVLVSPVTKNSASSGLGGLGALANQFGGLAALAGVTLGGDVAKNESIAVLQSEALTQRYISENDLLPVLFAKQWDPATKSWMNNDPEKKPTLWKAYHYFRKKVRRINEDKKTGLLTVTVTWTDPQTAARWANGLVRMTNDYLRAKAISEAERHIMYLNQEVAKTDIVQVQTSIYTILESEIKNAMLAKGTDEYALRVLDPATPPEKQTSPKFMLWLLAGLVGGATASAFFVVARRVLW